MDNSTTLAITEEGRVYRIRPHGRPLLLGHIAGLLREKTPLGREVRAWWRARLASDEHGENLVVPRGGDELCSLRVPLSEATLVIQSEPDQEMAQELADALAAD